VEWFILPISLFFWLILQDHPEFRQRYYEFVEYFEIPDGPIFLVIGGESELTGIDNDYVGVSC